MDNSKMIIWLAECFLIMAVLFALQIPLRKKEEAGFTHRPVTD